MDRDDQLAYCKICKNREFNRQTGIVCKLTGAKADFIGECADFMEDESHVSKYGVPQKELKLDSITVGGSVRFINYLIDRVVLFGLTIGTGVLLGLFVPAFARQISTVEDYAISFGIFVVYYTVFESIAQVSLGKLVTGTVVVDMDGKKPNFGTILGRSCCRLIPFDALSFLGSNSVGWHDSISKTRVVKKGSVVNNVNSEILDSDFESEFN